MINTALLCISGLFWGMHGGSYQRQCRCGLRVARGDVGQWLPSGHRIEHSERTHQASNHPAHSGQHHHRYLCVMCDISACGSIIFCFTSSMSCFLCAGSTNVGEQLPTGQLSVVPWRRTGVKYTNNEAYFDVVEEIDAIIDKSGRSLPYPVASLCLLGTNILSSFAQP